MHRQGVTKAGFRLHPSVRVYLPSQLAVQPKSQCMLLAKVRKRLNRLVCQQSGVNTKPSELS